MPRCPLAPMPLCAGLLALGTVVLLPTPTASAQDAAAVSTTVAVGTYFSCAVHDGRAYCWGNNDDGQLGDGGEVMRAAPAAVPGVTGVVEIGAGYGHACARTAGGEVFCWGDNSNRQVPGATGEEARQAVRVAGVMARRGWR